MSAQPYQPSALSDVTVSVDGDDTVVSFPRVLPYSVEKVWEAITTRRCWRNGRRTPPIGT